MVVVVVVVVVVVIVVVVDDGEPIEDLEELGGMVVALVEVVDLPPVDDAPLGAEVVVVDPDGTMVPSPEPTVGPTEKPVKVAVVPLPASGVGAATWPERGAQGSIDAAA